MATDEAAQRLQTIFHEEALAHLRALGECLQRMEGEPEMRIQMANIVHTLKGAARVAGETGVERLMFACEDLLAVNASWSAEQHELLQQAAALGVALLAEPQALQRNRMLALVADMDAKTARLREGGLPETQAESAPEVGNHRQESVKTESPVR